jgi:hypothetical protein
VEGWDAEDFDPWETLDSETVRVFFYRPHKPDGTVVEAYWLPNFASSSVGPQSLFRMAKSRWEIENQGFNDTKSRHGLEHICHHHANSLLIDGQGRHGEEPAERLYGLRYLHRGKHRVRSSAQSLLLQWLSLSRRCPPTVADAQQKKRKAHILRIRLLCNHKSFPEPQHHKGRHLPENRPLLPPRPSDKKSCRNPRFFFRPPQ